jgi:transposase InsO family protein
MISTLLRSLISTLASHRKLALENLALRQQIAVLRRSVNRPHLKKGDRLFWALLSRIWTNWAETLTIVKPETVIRWHRKGFRLYWTWKSRRKGKGRPAVASAIRELIRKMSWANPCWGAPRVHGELLKLGIDISQAAVSKYMVRHRKPPSQSWRTFLDNHVGDLVSVDFFTVTTVTFKVLCVFVVLAHDRRRVIHFNVTGSPTAKWTAQQIVEAFPWDTAPRYLLRDRDGIYGHEFTSRVDHVGIKEVKTAPRSPWQSPYVERLIGTLRRDCLDHVIVLSENHLRRIIRGYLGYYHSCRTHLSLEKDSLESRPVESPDISSWTLQWSVRRSWCPFCTSSLL